MEDFVTSENDVIKNVMTLDRYRTGNKSEKKFYSDRIKNGKVFVVLKLDNKYLFAPSKFAGYRDNDLSHKDRLDYRDGRLTDLRMRKLFGEPCEQGSLRYNEIDQAFVEYCRNFGLVASSHRRLRRFWIIGERSIEGSNNILAEELPLDMVLYEGLAEKIFVNKFERNPEARSKCIAHYGYTCSVCKFDFEESFGALGKNFIHVHHVVPLSEIRKKYKIDPIKDLRPVCPNCHAMLHKTNPVLSIERLKKLRQTK